MYVVLVSIMVISLVKKGLLIMVWVSGKICGRLKIIIIMISSGRL